MRFRPGIEWIILGTADRFQVNGNKVGRCQKMSVKGPVRTSIKRNKCSTVTPLLEPEIRGSKSTGRQEGRQLCLQPQEIAPGRLIYPSCTLSQKGLCVESFMHTWLAQVAPPPQALWSLVTLESCHRELHLNNGPSSLTCREAWVIFH